MARISQIEKERIRQKILDVSRTFFFDVGYENTSTKMIAKKVGIAEGTIFNYFPSKTDIFIESIYDNYVDNIEVYKDILNVEENITEVIVDYLFTTMKFLLKISRGILSEMVVQGVKMAKRNPERFKKMVELDLKYIKEIEKYISQLVDKKILYEVDSRQFSEMIYSVLTFEVMIFLYDRSIKKTEMMKNIKKKINILIKGYLIGGRIDEH